MKRLGLMVLLVFGMWCVQDVRSDSIWERRDPRFYRLFEDQLARRVGDLLTIAISESTIFNAMDDRTLDKETKTNGVFGLSGAFTAGKKLNRSFSGNFNGSGNTQRQLTGKADEQMNRQFTDRMTVVVVEVLPNGNLVVEGYRKRSMTDEGRLLRVTGIVRPQDIATGNIVQSQFIGNLTVTYQGKGADTSYTTNGWLGKVFNYIWPF